MVKGGCKAFLLLKKTNNNTSFLRSFEKYVSTQDESVTPEHVREPVRLAECVWEVSQAEQEQIQSSALQASGLLVYETKG